MVWGMAAVWIGFALLQINDPDRLFWIFVYGTTAFYTAASALGRLPRAVAVGWGVLWLCGATWLFAFWDGSGPHMGPAFLGPLADELLREILGLTLVGLWSGFLAWRAEPPDPP